MAATLLAHATNLDVVAMDWRSSMPSLVIAFTQFLLPASMLVSLLLRGTPLVTGWLTRLPLMDLVAPALEA